MTVADPLDDVIVDKTGVCRWSDVAAAQTRIRQAHEDRIAAMESVLRDINNKQFDLVADDLKMWSHAGGQFVRGLYNRRVAEGRLFNTAVTA